VLAGLRHSNVVRFFGHGTIAVGGGSNVTVYFLVVERLTCTLDDALASQREAERGCGGGACTVAKRCLEALPTLEGVVNALHYLHFAASATHAICHRDLKPDNIGFAADGTVKLFDLGKRASSCRRVTGEGEGGTTRSHGSLFTSCCGASLLPLKASPP
jgi:serine/threonine protein kinase